MPKPYKKESKVKFYARCIPAVMDKGTAKNLKQALVICSMLHARIKKKYDCGLNWVLLFPFGLFGREFFVQKNTKKHQFPIKVKKD